MPGGIKRDNFRFRKTNSALSAALVSLLKNRSFNRITVNDLCAEASISRTAFYSRYNDKYDLLRHWLSAQKPGFSIKNEPYEDVEKRINGIINDSERVIRSLFEETNAETYNIICGFILSVLELDAVADTDGGARECLVLARIVSGGICDYIGYHAQKKFKAGFPVMNPEFYGLLARLLRWPS